MARGLVFKTCNYSYMTWPDSNRICHIGFYDWRNTCSLLAWLKGWGPSVSLVKIDCLRPRAIDGFPGALQKDDSLSERPAPGISLNKPYFISRRGLICNLGESNMQWVSILHLISASCSIHPHMTKNPYNMTKISVNGIWVGVVFNTCWYGAYSFCFPPGYGTKLWPCLSFDQTG